MNNENRQIVSKELSLLLNVIFSEQLHVSAVQALSGDDTVSLRTMMAKRFAQQQQYIKDTFKEICCALYNANDNNFDQFLESLTYSLIDNLPPTAR